jgi:hypothetical protein
MVGEAQQDQRMVRREQIEVVAIDSPIDEQAHAHNAINPSARVARLDRRLDHRPELVEPGVGDRVARQAYPARVGCVVHVRVVEAGNDEPPVQLEDLGIPADELFDSGAVTDSGDAALINRQRLGPQVVAVGGEDATAHKHPLDPSRRGRQVSRAPPQARCRHSTGGRGRHVTRSPTAPSQGRHVSAPPMGCASPC